MTPDEVWLSTLWPTVRAQLPATPARILEIGCGASGGFVPMMQTHGYLASLFHRFPANTSSERREKCLAVRENWGS
jgi:hypothetical protein